MWTLRWIKKSIQILFLLYTYSSNRISIIIVVYDIFFKYFSPIFMDKRGQFKQTYKLVIVFFYSNVVSSEHFFSFLSILEKSKFMKHVSWFVQKKRTILIMQLEILCFI